MSRAHWRKEYKEEEGPSASKLINKYRKIDMELDELDELDPASAPAEECNNDDDLENKNEEIKKEVLPTVATVAVVAVGVTVIEAALLPGVILGVVAVAAPSALPWLFKKTVKGLAKAGKKGREFIHETHEKIEDIIAEVEGEDKL